MLIRVVDLAAALSVSLSRELFASLVEALVASFPATVKQQREFAVFQTLSALR